MAFIRTYETEERTTASELLFNGVNNYLYASGETDFQPTSTFTVFGRFRTTDTKYILFNN